MASLFRKSTPFHATGRPQGWRVSCERRTVRKLGKLGRNGTNPLTNLAANTQSWHQRNGSERPMLEDADLRLASCATSSRIRRSVEWKSTMSPPLVEDLEGTCCWQDAGNQHTHARGRSTLALPLSAEPPIQPVVSPAAVVAQHTSAWSRLQGALQSPP